MEDRNAAYGSLPLQFGMTLGDSLLEAWQQTVDDARCSLEESRPGFLSRVNGLYQFAAKLMIKRYPNLMISR